MKKRVVGFDAKRVKRKKPDFQALLGVAVTVDNYDKFAKEYKEIIQKLFDEVDIDFFQKKLPYTKKFIGAHIP